MRLAVLLMFALVACSDSYWKLDMKWRPVGVQILYYDTQEAFKGMCPEGAMACTMRYGENSLAVIYMGPLADECTLRHEFRHVAGWSHDGRDIYRQDCGAD